LSAYNLVSDPAMVARGFIEIKNIADCNYGYNSLMVGQVYKKIRNVKGGKNSKDQRQSEF